MQKFFSKIKMMVLDKQIRNKILFVIGALFVFRLLSTVPIPGVDTLQLNRFLSNNQFFGILNIFSGGGYGPLVDRHGELPDKKKRCFWHPFSCLNYARISYFGM
jgi:preprotein translocase subunit SecY